MSASKTKGYLLTGSAGVAIAPMLGLALTPMANAADLAVKAPLLKAPPRVMPTWTGCYIGADIGAAGQWSHFDDSVAHDNVPVGDHTGWTVAGGGLAGCNYQTGTFVFGLEGDYSGLSKPSTDFNFLSTGGTSEGPYGSHISWMATVRGRLGFTFGDGMNLIYATGGVAFTKVNASAFETFGGGSSSDYSASRTGWVVGGGYERMLTPNWIIGFEGLFADFGSYSAGNSEGKCCANIHNKVIVERVRLSYKF
jgi:outer membrane immunogenic protein